MTSARQKITPPVAQSLSISPGLTMELPEGARADGTWIGILTKRLYVRIQYVYFQSTAGPLVPG